MRRNSGLVGVTSKVNSSEAKGIHGSFDQYNSKFSGDWPQFQVKSVVNIDGNVFGSPVQFESSGPNAISATYDSTNDKVVIAYRDDNNNNYGTAIVGTVSGNSISFGNPVVFSSDNTSNISATFDSSNNKVVIAYRDVGNNSYGRAIVGTVSGTSISFGNPVAFESANTLYISSTYDYDNKKIVIVYRDSDNSGYGTAIVGTVSGTSISFGNPVVFLSASLLSNSVVYDSTNRKVVIAYSDGGSGSQGTAIVGNVSGTSISFGSARRYEYAFNDYVTATYDTHNSKVVIAFRGGSNYLKSVVADVSGTTITFGTPIVVHDTSVLDISPTFDVINKKPVITYRDNNDSSQGKAIVGTVSDTSITFGSPFVIESDGTRYFSTIYDSTSGKIVSAYNADYAQGRVVVGNLSGTLNEETNNTITVTSSGVPDNTTLYYSVATVSGTTLTSADFTTGDVTGNFTVTNNSGSFILRPAGDDLSESNEVKIQIRRGSTSGDILGETGTLTIADAAAPTGAPEFNWRYYAFGSSIGTTRIHWRETNGTMYTLRTITGQQHTSALQTWDTYSEDLSTYSGTTGRIYISYQVGSYWRNDPQFDNMELVDTTSGTISHDPGTSTGRARWEKSTSYTSSSSSIPSTFSSVTTSTSTSNRWNYDSGGTPSGSTGGTRDADGSSSGYYLYFEGSSPNYTTSTRLYWVRMSSDYTLL